jgi:pimeloyl-ACP methyl ester carboxylesterase
VDRPPLVTVSPEDDEPVAAPADGPAAPPGLVDPSNEMRLAEWLRVVAARPDPVEALTLAARTLLRARRERSEALESAAYALADLAVSGTHALARFEGVALASGDIAARIGSPGARDAAAEVLERARGVAAHLGAFRAQRPDRRFPPVVAARRWIAVSAEDDRPHTPVNVEPAPFPQFVIDVPVPVDGTTMILRTRFMVAGRPLRDVVDDGRTRAKVILLLHGQGSRLEEYVELASMLSAVDPRTRLPRYTVIAPDLPSCGYTRMIDPDVVATPPTLHEAATSDPERHPLLQFHDRFLVAFVHMLDELLGTGKNGLSLSDHIVCVGGGSLGGSLALRLAELEPTPWWVRRLVAWSAASLWDPLRNDAVKGLGPNLLKSKMVELETPDRRKDFIGFLFDRPILGALGGPPQASMWYREGWPLKDAFLAAARRKRQEVYNVDYRRWTYRLAYDQLQFSHKDRDLGVPYTRVRVPTMLAAGDGDNYGFARIRDRTVEAGERMTAPGPTYVVTRTGHSIHNERPRWLAGVIDAFLREFGVR